MKTGLLQKSFFPSAGQLNRQYGLFCFTVMAIMGILYAAPAYALLYGPIGAQVPCPFDDGFTFLVVTCLQAAIEDATYRMLAEFSLIMEGPIGALIVFNISLFGVQAVMGVSEINKKALALVIKIGCVLVFADNLGGFAPDVFAIMVEAQKLVIDNIGYTGNFECEVTAAAASAFFNSAIWLKMDCLLDKLFQFEQPAMLFNAIFALISAALFSGSVGVMVFFMGLTALLNVLGFVFYAVWIFILAYIYVGFLIVISPLIVPLLLLGVTAESFGRWLDNVIAGIAIPVFVFAYLTLTLPLLDYVIFTAPESLEEVLGDDYTLWYRNEQQWCSQQVGTDQDDYQNVPNLGFDYITGPLKSILTPMMSGNTDLCATFGTSSLDFFEDHIPMMMKILDSLIKLLVVAYLLGSMMKQMPNVGAAIFHGGFGLLDRDGLPFSSALRGGLQEARTSMTRAVGSLGNGGGGAGFLSQGLPGASKGIQGLFK